MYNDGVKPSILIVDDAPENLDILKATLMDTYMVRPALNGPLALRLAAMEPQPDLILLDIMMPGMDGYEVCRQLKRNIQTQDIPVIFVTAKSGDQDELDGFQLGAVDYITKPLSPAVVKARVRTHLALRHFNREMEEKNRRLYEINERLTDSMEQLSASEDRFRSLVQTIPDIVYKIDAEGRFTFLNKSVERLGYHQSDLIGKHFSEIIHSADVQDVSLAKVLDRIGKGTANPAQKLFDERRSGVRMTVGLELRLRAKSGRSEEVYELKNIDQHCVNVEVNSTGLYGEVGHETSYRTRQYIGTVGVIRDITDRQKAQNAFVEERKLLRQLINAVPLPIFFFAPHGELIFSNAAFQQFVGLEGDSLEGVGLDDLFCVDDQPRLRALLQGLLDASGSEPLRQELTLKSIHGQERTVQLILLKFHRSAQAQSMVIGVLVDVTEQREFTAQLIQARQQAERMAEKAELASRAKGEFLANMSHEIRTPLNAVIGLTHLCLQTSLTGQQRDYLGKVGISAHALLQLINDILDFSRIEAGRLTMESLSFTLDELLGGVMAVASVKSQEKGLALLLDTRADLPRQLRGDLHRLGQVLINLVGNAIKFTEQGEVVITTERLEERDGAVVLQFSVRDTGIGMTPEQVERLFQEFSQGDASITRKYGGTGLGLAISKRLVELMGGQISVESKPGQGSCFRFTVRCTEVEGEAGGPPLATEAIHGWRLPVAAHGGARLAGARVLLAEDNEINQQVAKELLEQVGVQVLLAWNGQEAVDLLGRESVDAILLDMQMPVLDGLAAARFIRQEMGVAQIPIIAMTANAMSGDREKCLAAGMNDHIAKPVAPEDLYATLARWLQERPALQGGPLPGWVGGAEAAALPPLPAIPGIDTLRGIRNVGGKTVLYRSVLRKFARNQGGGGGGDGAGPGRRGCPVAGTDGPCPERGGGDHWGGTTG
ncbi:MAG: response regulator [Magnetococcus sp. XQGC-1]